jgi:hypothetical protein
MRLDIPLISKVVIIKVGKAPVPATGITNRAYTKTRKPLDYYATFLDYDGASIHKVRREVAWLQAEFDLGSAFIWATDVNSYHVVCPSLTSWLDQVEILHLAAIDPIYKHEFVRYGERTLRVSGKGSKAAPVFKEIIRASTTRPVSLAHVHYCMHSAGIGNDVLERFQGGVVQTRLQVVKYHTGKY